MTKITVYDVDERRIDDLANANNVTDAQIVEALLDILEQENIDIAEYI